MDHGETEYMVVITLQQLQGGQEANIVQGEGEVRAPEETFAFSVENGTFRPRSNDVTLSQQYDAGRPGQMQGTVADDLEAMTVTITGGPVGFDGEEFTLNKLDQ